MSTSANNSGPAKTADSLKQRYQQVRERIGEAAERSGRSADDIFLVAVGKYAEVDDIRALIDLGHQDFGESRVKQLVARSKEISDWQTQRGDSTSSPIRWHMIGTLQRKKVKKAITPARLIHSVDSHLLAETIQEQAQKLEQTVEILLQVNLSGEQSKHGVTIRAVRHVIEMMETMTNLNTRGLMCMAPFCENPQDTEPVFRRCRELFDELREAGVGGERFDILSMGMSNDYEVAIECGANVVRVGSAVFGSNR